MASEAAPRRPATGGETLLLVSIDDTAAVEVVRGDLDADLVAGQHADAEAPHLAGEMREQLVIVLELHAEQQVRRGLGDLAVDFELLLYRHRTLLLDCMGKPPARRRLPYILELRGGGPAGEFCVFVQAIERRRLELAYP